MNFHELNQYIEIYNCQSIKQAANNLYISAQAISKNLLKLEKELNVKLFLRTHNRLIPTNEGNKLYRYAQKIIQDYQNMTIDLQMLQTNKATTLRIASTYGVIEELSIQFIKDFYQAYPNIHLDFFEVTDRQLITMLNNKEINFAFVTMPFNHLDYSGDYLFKQHFCLLINTNNPLSNYQYITYEMLQDIPLAIKGREFHIFNKNINKFSSQGIQPNIYIETSSEQLIYQFVAENLGVGVVLEHQFPNLPNNIKRCYFQDPSWIRQIALIKRNDEKLNQREQEFISFTIDWCKKFFNEKAIMPETL